MSQMPVTPQGFDTAKPPTDRRVRHGLIEDWRDAVGILLLLTVAAFFGALIAHMWPETDDGAPGNASDVSARLAALESKQPIGKPSDITALKDRIAKLEAKISVFETALGGGAATLTIGTPATGPLPGTALAPFGNPILETAKRVDDIGVRLAALETKTATAPDDIKATKTVVDSLAGTTSGLTLRVEGVAERLLKLESSDLLTLARRASLASSIANLTRAAQGSSPFKNEYDVVAALIPGDTHLSEIASIAATGIPTTGTLISTFGSNADAAMDAQNLSQGKTWWTRLWANFASLVSWRSTNETEGASTESRLARAGIRLKAGDLEATVKELNAIKGAARKPLAPWLNQAAARVKLEATLATLNTQAVEAITGSTETNEPVPQLPTP